MFNMKKIFLSVCVCVGNLFKAWEIFYNIPCHTDRIVAHQYWQSTNMNWIKWGCILILKTPPPPHPKTQCSGMSHSFWVSVLKNIHFSDHELKGYPSPCDAGGSQYCSLCLCIHQKAQFLKEGSEQQEPESVLACSQRVADHQGT